MTFELSLEAEIDISRIADDLERKNPATAFLALRKIHAALNRLPLFPNLGRVGRIDGTRELVVSDTPYLIVYMLSERLVFILRIVHGAQYWPDSNSWQDE